MCDGGCAMTADQRLARIVVASWVLANGSKRIPTERGLLDRALKRAVEEGAFARESIEFVDTGEALVCVQGEAIIDEAQGLGLTAAPNPSYAQAESRISERGAIHLLHDVNRTREEAVVWGQILARAIESSREELRAFRVAGRALA